MTHWTSHSRYILLSVAAREPAQLCGCPMLCNRELSEEVRQQTFLAAFRDFDRFSIRRGVPVPSSS
jgi:hypothetical protein